MPEKKGLTYEERRNHIHNLINNRLEDTTLRDICRWMGRETLSEYQYVWQVLDGSYGKSKRSPSVLRDLEETLQDKGLWSQYEV